MTAMITPPERVFCSLAWLLGKTDGLGIEDARIILARAHELSLSAASPNELRCQLLAEVISPPD